jgi:hypothetical protein
MFRGYDLNVCIHIVVGRASSINRVQTPQTLPENEAEADMMADVMDQLAESWR